MSSAAYTPAMVGAAVVASRMRPTATSIMSNVTRTTLQLIGMLGAVLIALATFVAWYSYDVVFAIGRLVHVFSVPADLWGPYTLAAVLLLAGAAFALVLLNLPPAIPSRVAGVLVLAIAIAIGAWSIVRAVDIPSLGVGQVSGPVPTAAAQTSVTGGPFLALAGAVMLAAGSLPLLAAASASERARARVASPRGTPPTGAAPAM
jgi:hypothetical protein